MKLKDNNLDEIIGGASSTSLTGAVITALTNIIKVIFDAGNSVGTSIRRLTDQEGICPLERVENTE